MPFSKISTLVIPNVLFIWYYAVLIFTSKLRDPPQKKITQYNTHTEIKISDHPPSKDFSEILAPSKLEGGGGCVPCLLDHMLKYSLPSLALYTLNL